jgi:hypothetical protein
MIGAAESRSHLLLVGWQDQLPAMEQPYTVASDLLAPGIMASTNARSSTALVMSIGSFTTGDDDTTPMRRQPTPAICRLYAHLGSPGGTDQERAINDRDY